MLIETHMDIMPSSAKRVCREGSLETDKESSIDISPVQTPDLETVRPKTRKHPKSSLKSGNQFLNRLTDWVLLCIQGEGLLRMR